VQSVASDTKSFAVKPSTPQPRQQPASDRAPSSPFESLLDDGTQSAAPPPPQKPSHAARPDRSRPPASAKSASHTERVKTTKADKPDTADQPVADDQTNVASGKVSGNIVITDATADGDKTKDNTTDSKSGGDDKTKTDGKKADATADAQGIAAGILPPDTDKPAIVSIVTSPLPTVGDPAPDPSKDGAGKDKADVAADAQGIAAGILPPNTDKPAIVSIATSPLPTVGDPAPDPSKDGAGKDDAPAPSPAQLTEALAVAVAPAVEPVKQAPSADRKTEAVTTDTSKGKASALLSAQTDDGKSADDPKAPAQDASHAQDDGQPQAAIADTDKQAIAQARGEAPANGHRTSAPDAAAPDASGNATAPTAKSGTDIVQTLAANAPQHNAAATNPAQPLPQNLSAVAVPLNGIAVAIAGKALEGKNRFEIRLDPPELGRIEVRLDVNKDGSVTSHLIADRQDTLNLLQRDAASLQRALQDSGLKTADNGLQFSLRDQSNPQQQDTSGSQTAQLMIPDETLNPVEPVSSRYAQLAILRGGLDITV
jgi:flagellar hook-length control protein FliK